MCIHTHTFIHLTTNLYVPPIMCQVLSSLLFIWEIAVNMEFTFITQNLTLPCVMHVDILFSI